MSVLVCKLTPSFINILVFVKKKPLFFILGGRAGSFHEHVRPKAPAAGANEGEVGSRQPDGQPLSQNPLGFMTTHMSAASIASSTESSAGMSFWIQTVLASFVSLFFSQGNRARGFLSQLLLLPRVVEWRTLFLRGMGNYFFCPCAKFSHKLIILSSGATEMDSLSSNDETRRCLMDTELEVATGAPVVTSTSPDLSATSSKLPETQMNQPSQNTGAIPKSIR